MTQQAIHDANLRTQLADERKRAEELDTLTTMQDGGIRGLHAQIRALTERAEKAERALARNGYRQSCDIAACNCGDQWNHGGRADERLREIDDALPWENGKTILQRVSDLTAQLATVTASLRRAGGSLYEDVPRHIGSLVEERDQLQVTVTRFTTALKDIFAYAGSNGCCPYGCDTPEIARRALQGD